jgi:hypothetical protein
MHGRTIRIAALFAAAAFGLILGVAGCSSDGQITAPTPPARTETARPQGDGFGWGFGGADRIFSISVPVDGAVGGVVSVGGITLNFPPGAFEGTRTITVVGANSSFKECLLFPEGLKFSQPVQLSMVLKGLKGDGPDASIFWWNPADGSWVDLHGTWDAKAHTVTANLQHFSVYRGGRAGW